MQNTNVRPAFSPRPASRLSSLVINENAEGSSQTVESRSSQGQPGQSRLPQIGPDGDSRTRAQSPPRSQLLPFSEHRPSRSFTAAAQPALGTPAPLETAITYVEPVYVTLTRLQSEPIEADTKECIRRRITAAGGTPLHIAVFLGADADEIRDLIASGFNVNARDANGLTAVDVLLQYGKNIYACFHALKSAGADFSLPDNNGNTLLHRAIVRLDLFGSILCLSPRCCDPNGFNQSTDVTLGRYAPRPQTVQRADDFFNIDNRKNPAATPLHLAAAFCIDPMFISTLVLHGAAVDVRDDYERTPLHWAARLSKNPAILRVLIEGGANLHVQDAGSWKMVPGVAASSPDLPVRNMRVNLDGMTALEWVFQGDMSIAAEKVEVLRKAGANLGLPDRDENTLLHRLVMNGNLTNIEILLDNGADVNASNKTTRLKIAAHCHGLRGAQVTSAFASAMSPTGSTATPLHLAAAFGSDPRLISMLTQHGAIVDKRNSRSATPLHWAAMHSANSDVIDALLEAGANAELADGAGNTALTLARRRRDPKGAEVVAALEKLYQPADTPHLSSDAVDRASADFAFALDLQRCEDEFYEAQLTVFSAEMSGEYDGSSTVAITAASAAVRHQERIDRIAECRTIGLVRNVDHWFDSETSELDDAAYDRVVAWHTIQGNLDEPQQQALGVFLCRLTETADYKDVRLRPPFCKRISTLLNAMQCDPELRDRCIAITGDLNDTCGDGVTLTLNRIDFAHINQLAESGNLGLEEMAKIRTGMFRLELLQGIANEKVASLREALDYEPDEVEVLLGFQTLLADRLKLPGVSKRMLYEGVSQISDEDLNGAVEKITDRENRKDHIEFIADWEPWRKALERLYPEKFGELYRQREEDQEEMSIPPPGYSDIDYIHECEDLSKMHAAREKFLRNNLTRKFLEGRPALDA